jgi:hypothetical protein
LEILTGSLLIIAKILVPKKSEYFANENLINISNNLFNFQYSKFPTYLEEALIDMLCKWILMAFEFVDFNL